MHARQAFHPFALLLTAIALTLSPAPAARASQAAPLSEACGWLVQKDDGLDERAEPQLHPQNGKPLPTPPAEARAAYCVRDTMMTYVGDEQILKLGLPLVIRSGAREGVLEVNPSVLFNYHKQGDHHYLPGRDKGPP